jgi:DNA-binding beta-propeller fold protein YncE
MALRSVALSLALALVCGLSWGQKPALILEKTIPLPGVKGRIDHLSADVEDGCIYIAELGNGTVEVVDVNRRQRAGQIKGLEEPQGLLYLPSNHTLYVATGGDGMVRSYDGQTLAPVKAISLGDDADNLRYDVQQQRVMVGYGDGAVASLSLDLSSKTEVELPAHPESFQFSPDGAHLFVNLPHDQSVAFIDLARMRVAAKWDHLGAQANFPMAIDPGDDRIFIGCRTPARLLALSTKTGAATERAEIVGDTDDLFFDPAHGRIYVIGGEGFIDVIDAPKSGKLNSIGHIPTAAGARTGLFVPAWNKLVVAAPHRGSEPARLFVYALP